MLVFYDITTAKLAGQSIFDAQNQKMNLSDGKPIDN